MFKFFKNKYLDAPVTKRDKAHIMLDNIIDQPDILLSFDMTEDLNKYIKGLKTVYEFKEI